MSADKQVRFSCGIDLGTTFSCIAVGREISDKDNRLIVDVIDNNGKTTTPSWVGFKGDKMSVGLLAKNQASSNRKNTIYDAKRIIGHKIDDESVQKDLKSWPFKVVDDGNKNPLFEVEYQSKIQRFTPQQISSFILKNIVDMALPKVLGDYDENITKNVIITIPAYFTDAQRRATIEAGTLAGLNVLRVINEPTAAAIAYGYNNKKENRTILVYDFGGGTFDVSIIKVVGNEVTVLATDGNDHLGGEDITNILVEFFCHEIGIDIESKSQLIPRIKAACDNAKILLSSTNDSDIFVDVEDDTKSLTVSRAKLDDICKDLYNKTIEIVERALQSKSISKKDIDDVVLVGGSSRIPMIEELLRKCFPGKNINKDINPDEAVATGAALLAADLIKGTYEHSFSNGAKAIVDIKNDEILGTITNIKPPKDEINEEMNGTITVKNGSMKYSSNGDRITTKRTFKSNKSTINERLPSPIPLSIVEEEYPIESFTESFTATTSKSTFKCEKSVLQQPPPPPPPHSSDQTIPLVTEDKHQSETLTVTGFKEPIKPATSATLVVKDVLSHSIGVNMHGDMLSVILEKNLSIPCKKEKSNYRPSRDGQSKMVLKLLEGEDPVASHNKIIRTYTIDGLPTDKKWSDFNFTYTMNLNENGILTFSYKEASNLVPEGTLAVDNI